MQVVLRLTVVVAVLFMHISSARAIEIHSSHAQYLALFDKLVSEKVQPAIAFLPLEQRERVESVEISIVDNMHAYSMAIAVDEVSPKIFINAGFITALSVYTDAYLLAETVGQPELIERYFQYYFTALESGHSAEDIPRPVTWAGLNRQKREEVAVLQQPVFEGVVLDVLLHELGHHAEKAFYSHRANQAVRDENESLADHWAESVKAKLFSPVDPLGRLISIAYIFERDRWAILTGDNAYPRLLPWVVDQLPQLCEDAVQARVTLFCARLENDIAQYMGSRIANTYAQRINQGEDYARFPLAQILFAQSNFVEACNYFSDSLIYGQVAGAAVYVSWCYQKGYLDHSPPDAEVLAMTHMRGGIGYGYSDKIVVPSLF